MCLVVVEGATSYGRVEPFFIPLAWNQRVQQSRNRVNRLLVARGSSSLGRLGILARC